MFISQRPLKKKKKTYLIHATGGPPAGTHSCDESRNTKICTLFGILSSLSSREVQR